MDAAVSGRSSYGGDAGEEENKPRVIVNHHRFGGDNIAVKVEKRSPDQQDKENDMKMEICLSGDPDSSSTTSNQNEQNDRLESARAEMGEVKQENERLKMYLERIMREYKALQMKFLETVKQSDQDLDDHDKNNNKSPPVAFDRIPEDHDHTSLSLGPSNVSGSSLEKKKKTVSTNWGSFGVDHHKENNLELSLNCKGASKLSETITNASSNSPINLSPENSFEDQKEETDEFRPASKVEKRSGDDEVSQQQSAAKKTRVSVRARCDTPTMHDGCQWRKYGQKISKGNPCPRAYYRCTIAPSCPVRKQVQRCAEDMSILITTYEGSHNHPLPVSATAMASTTSAAASMLLSGSSSSSSPPNHQGLTPNATTDLHGLNFYLSDPSRSKQFYLPNTTSMSSAPTHPTITLDLTNSNPNSGFGQFGSTSSVYSPLQTRSYNMSTSVSFGSPEPISALPVSWGNGSLANYGQLYPKSQPDHQETFLHHQNNNHRQQDSIAAATKAITTDPNFQSALATALQSIIGGSGSTMGSNQGLDGLGQRLRWNSDNLINSSQSSALQAAPGCGSSFLNNSTTLAASNSQQLRNLGFAQPASFSSLPFSKPKNGSSTSSPNDSRDHSKLYRSSL